MKTLTKDIIKKELNKIYLHDVIEQGVILLLCVAYLVFYFLKPQLRIYRPESIVWLFSPIYVCFSVISVIKLYKTFNAYTLTKKGEIEIVKDVLLNKSKKSQFSKYRGYNYTYIFHFEKSGVCKIKKRILAIVNPYGMENEQLYNISQIDDKFYVVSVGKKKNILAYNMKLFELRG